MKDVITREQTNNFNKENKYPTKMGLTHILENKDSVKKYRLFCEKKIYNFSIFFLIL